MTDHLSAEARARQVLAATKHGAYAGGKESPEHYVWRSMLQRCNNSNHKAYHYYGGRGIKVCKRWFEYPNFIADMGNRPSDKHTLERVDNNKGYSPSNCIWALPKEQIVNRRNTRWFTDGVFTGCVADCAKRVGISKALAHYRVRKWGSLTKDGKWQEVQKV